MFSDPTFLLATVAVLVVAGVLIFGIGSFARGGDFNRRNGNKLMRLRLIAQFVAVVLITGFAWLNSGGN